MGPPIFVKQNLFTLLRLCWSGERERVSLVVRVNLKCLTGERVPYLNRFEGCATVIKRVPIKDVIFHRGSCFVG